MPASASWKTWTSRSSTASRPAMAKSGGTFPISSAICCWSPAPNCPTPASMPTTNAASTTRAKPTPPSGRSPTSGAGSSSACSRARWPRKSSTEAKARAVRRAGGAALRSCGYHGGRLADVESLRGEARLAARLQARASDTARSRASIWSSAVVHRRRNMVIHPETIERLFRVPARQSRARVGTGSRHQAERGEDEHARKPAGAKPKQQNDGWLDAENEKLDNYADDLERAFEARDQGRRSRNQGSQEGPARLQPAIGREARRKAPHQRLGRQARQDEGRIFRPKRARSAPRSRRCSTRFRRASRCNRP